MNAQLGVVNVALCPELDNEGCIKLPGARDVPARSSDGWEQCLILKAIYQTWGRCGPGRPALRELDAALLDHERCKFELSQLIDLFHHTIEWRIEKRSI